MYVLVLSMGLDDLVDITTGSDLSSYSTSLIGLYALLVHTQHLL